MDDITIRITRRLISEGSLSREEIEDSIEVAMERLASMSKTTKTVTMRGIVAFLQKIGLQNKPEYRKKAVSIIKDMGLRVATT